MIKKEYFIGVDIGGTNTSFGLVDSDYNIVKYDIIKTKAQEGFNSYLQRLLDHIIKLNESENVYSIKGIGLAAPSANFLTGTIENSVNLKWENINLVNLVKKHFDIPITLINDANAAALGEQISGAAVGMKNFIVLTLGTGLGSGIVYNGKLILGENGQAGELGHLVIQPNGRKCNCGKKGCLETYVSANGLRRTVLNLISYTDKDTEFKKISYNNLTSELVSELAMKDDFIAKKAFNFTGKIFGQALSNIVTFYDPQAFILSGGLTEAGDLLLKPTQLYFKKNLLKIYQGKVKIIKSGLESGSSGILGSVSFLRYKIDNQKNHSLSINDKPNLYRNDKQYS